MTRDAPPLGQRLLWAIMCIWCCYICRVVERRTGVSKQLFATTHNQVGWSQPAARIFVRRLDRWLKRRQPNMWTVDLIHSKNRTSLRHRGIRFLASQFCPSSRRSLPTHAVGPNTCSAFAVHVGVIRTVWSDQLAPSHLVIPWVSELDLWHHSRASRRLHYRLTTFSA